MIFKNDYFLNIPWEKKDFFLPPREPYAAQLFKTVGLLLNLSETIYF